MGSPSATITEVGVVIIMRTEELRYGLGERQVVDVRMPVDGSGRVGLYFIHGGGWYAGHRQQFSRHLDHFACLGYPAASTGYRIDQAAGFRDKYADVAAGLGSFRERLAEPDASSVDRIVVLGSSAGAHLATMLALRSAESDDDQLPIAGCVSINGPGTLEPWPGMDEGIRTKIEWLRSDGSTPDEISPDHQVRPGCPPFLFLLAEHEHLLPHEHIHTLAAAIERAGAGTETVIIPETEHGFIYHFDGLAQHRALELITTFLEEVSRSEPAGR